LDIAFPTGIERAVKHFTLLKKSYQYFDEQGIGRRVVSLPMVSVKT